MLLWSAGFHFIPSFIQCFLNVKTVFGQNFLKSTFFPFIRVVLLHPANLTSDPWHQQSFLPATATGYYFYFFLNEPQEKKSILLQHRPAGFLEDNESSPSGTIATPHSQSLKSRFAALTQTCWTFCQLLALQSHSGRSEQLLYSLADGNKVLDCSVDGANWKKKKRARWGGGRIGCFEVSANRQKVKFAMLLFFICLVRMERMLSLPFYRLHVLLWRSREPRRRPGIFFPLLSGEQLVDVFSPEFSANSAEPFGPECK